MAAIDFAGEKWRTFLPDSYGWVDKLNVKQVTNPIVGAHHIIPVSGNPDQGDKFDILATGLSEDCKKALQHAAKTTGWQSKTGPTKFIVDQATYVLVPVSRMKTSASQISRQVGLDATRILKGCKVAHLVFCDATGIDPFDSWDGLTMGLYEPGLFKNALRKNPTTKDELPQAVSFWTKELPEKKLTRTKAMIKACSLVRMLQDAPPNWLDPPRFAEIAKDVATDFGAKIKILNRKEMAELGMGSFLSVALGSPKEAHLIVLEIDGKNNDKCVALVGKGLTFDSGGTSLKPGQGMGEMKYDMSGGAAVLGSALYLAKIKPPTKVICVIGAVENIGGGHATRPSDIVVAMNGKSIDVQNTDAEGRLVLADCLFYVSDKYKPDFMIDIATLTGAVLHALGHAGAGLMTNNQPFADRLLSLAKEVGEPYWQLPLWPELEREIKGENADLVNIAKPNVQAGTLIGGIFLNEFVGKTTWAHLDIAGTGWQCKSLGFSATGGSAFGLRLMTEACLRHEA